MVSNPSVCVIECVTESTALRISTLTAESECGGEFALTEKKLLLLLLVYERSAAVRDRPREQLCFAVISNAALPHRETAKRRERSEVALRC